MVPTNVANSPTAHRIRLTLTCDHCGHNSLETLNRFHGRYMIVCRECASVVNVKAKENRMVIEALLDLCGKIDASLGRPEKRH